MRADPMFGPRLKIERANEHINEIDRIAETYFTGDHYILVEELDPESGDRFLKVRVTEPIPKKTYILVAETAYHLRSTLDQMVNTIARAYGVPNAGNMKFPFASHKKTFESSRTQDKTR